MNRIGICEVYYLLESHLNVSGVLQERKSNQRRKMSTGYQLSRMGFRPSPMLSFDSIDSEQLELYANKVFEYFGDSVSSLDLLGDDVAYYSNSQDVIPILSDVGVLPQFPTIGIAINSPEWRNCEYSSVFVWRGVVFGMWGIVPYLDRSIEIIGVVES